MNMANDGVDARRQPDHKINMESAVADEASQEPLPKEFEQMLQKLESEVRGHIRLEQQLKLQLEAQQVKMEENVRQQYSGQLEGLQNVRMRRIYVSVS